MGYITDVLPINALKSKGIVKGRVYLAHGSDGTFMTELVVSLSSSQHIPYTLKKEGDSEKLRRKDRCNK